MGRPPHHPDLPRQSAEILRLEDLRVGHLLRVGGMVVVGQRLLAGCKRLTPSIRVLTRH